MARSCVKKKNVPLFTAKTYSNLIGIASEFSRRGQINERTALPFHYDSFGHVRPFLP